MQSLQNLSEHIDMIWLVLSSVSAAVATLLAIVGKIRAGRFGEALGVVIDAIEASEANACVKHQVTTRRRDTGGAVNTLIQDAVESRTSGGD